MMGALCTWCGTEFEPRSNGGKPQEFCAKECRQNFNTACRVWAAQEYRAEQVSIFTLKAALDQHARSIESDPASERGKAPEVEKCTGAPPGAAVPVVENVP